MLIFSIAVFLSVCEIKHAHTDRGGVKPQSGPYLSRWLSPRPTRRIGVILHFAGRTLYHRPSASLATVLRLTHRSQPSPDGSRAHGEIQEASAPQVINPAGRTRSDLFRRASRRTFCGNANGRSAADAIPLLPFSSWLQVPLGPSGSARSGPMHAGRYTCSRFRRVLYIG